MKINDLLKISDPIEVFKKAKQIYGQNVPIAISTKKDKKYMIFHNNKWIHFGSTMEDYTRHKDKKRLEAFKNRNKKWATADKYSPSYMSYWILW